MEQNKIDFSDEENDIIEEEETNELPEEYEMDSEMRAYIYQLTCKNSIDKEEFVLKEAPVKKKKKKKKKEKK